MTLRHRCCICKQSMITEGDPDRPFDPCSLILVTNINLESRDQKEQEFPCHFQCFRGLLADDSLMYIMEPDYSTNGEIEDEQES